ncbi:MAG: hypothetical protein GXO49_05150, partial [Chlorobi bacterium]|nr:hypothetical protein [Chlorobiota bacterium]
YFNVGDDFSKLTKKIKGSKEYIENTTFESMYKQIASDVKAGKGNGLTIDKRTLEPTKGLTDIDKKILISFANSIGFDEKNKHFPVWLK